MNVHTGPAGLLAQLVARVRALLRVVTLEGAFSLTAGKGGQ